MSQTQQFIIPETPAEPDCTTQEYVYERLRNAVMVGSIPPGTALTMRGLADMLNLSPTPIREAVRRLSSESAILISENRRISIPRMTLERFEELVALRINLETHAATRALPYMSDVKIKALTRIDDEMDTAVSDHNYDQLIILNQDFHRSLYCANPDPVTMPLIESIWLQLGPFQRQVLELLDDYYTVDRHKEILTALKSREATVLVSAINNDIYDSTVAAGRKLLAS